MKFQKIALPFKIKRSILALGSETKNTIGFAYGTAVYLSSVHQDLSNPQDFLAFERTVKYFLKRKPKTLVYDLHPEYRSTKYALGLPLERWRLKAAQHHHAHIASCMVDNGMKNEKVIGVAFDGTGLGPDNTLWGAEFLLCDYRGFRRLAHLRAIPLLGGEAAIRQPWRLALMWLFLAYGERLWNLELGLVKKLSRKQWRVLKNMYLTGFNSPLSSSMGRLFDAAGALVLAEKEAHFEAALAMELERLASRCRFRERISAYQFSIIKAKDGYIVDPLAVIKGIGADLKNKKPRENIAYRFHLTVAAMTRKMLERLRSNTGVNKVILSGGVFQNRLLCRTITDLLSQKDFEACLHRDISCNDAGIALGQIAVANHSN